MTQIIGRKREREILNQILTSKKAEFIAVYGRRRVGKTFIIEQFFSHADVYFECTGIKDGNMHDQLINFTQVFQTTFYPGLSLSPAKTWREAFELLTQEVKKIPESKQIVIFLDELPWLAKRKSKLLQNLDYFWNSHWRKMPNFKLIVCGSAASWMLEKLINAKGGLHNRITRSLLLEPFTLEETKKFLEANEIKLTEKQILDLYMVTGGVPFYLTQIQKSKSVSQNINDMCFQKDGLLYTEFPRLFKSLFESADLNLHIVREIAKNRYGISFSNLLQKCGKKAGGRFKQHLSELEAAGFIQMFLPYGRKKRDRYYKIIDEYTLFYLRWIEDVIASKSIPKGVNYWVNISKTPSWQSWAGYAFESICYKHTDKIINKLGLSSIGCLVGNWRHIPHQGKNDMGVQIDLLLDREDDAITLCEIKYSANPFMIDKSYAKNLMNKVDIFKNYFKTSKQIFLVMVTATGIKKNSWSKELMDGEVTLADLF